MTRQNNEIQEVYDKGSEQRKQAVSFFVDWFINEGIVLSRKHKKSLSTYIDAYISDEKMLKPFSFASTRKLRKQCKKFTKKPDQTFLIRMKYNNGTLKNFILSTTDMMFKHGSKWYFLYYEEAWFNINHKVYELEYHENFCLPINREVQLDNKNKEQQEIYANITPTNLKNTIDMEYVRALVSGEELSKFLKITMVLSAFTVLGMLLLAYQIYQMTKPVA